MDRSKLGERKSGTVKAAISSFGQKILEDNNNNNNPTIKNRFQTNYNPEKPYTKTRELHQVKRDTGHLNESIKLAELSTAEAKSELSSAKKTVKDLTLRIEESNSRAKAQGKKRMEEEEEWVDGNSHCAKVLKELESIKRELSKLKLDMASVLEEKKRAEKDIDSSLSKTELDLNSVEALDKELEEINEEHVLVELARIEAIKEYEEIEAERREKAKIHSAAVEEAMKKKESIVQEIEYVKELETKLAITTSDVDMLESELKQVKEMVKGVERNEIVKYTGESLSDPVTEELEAKRKELASIKEESFQFMASMDVVRNELRHVAHQTAKLRKREVKTETNIQNLNSKLMRAKSKLEATSEAEEKSKSIFSNLKLTLEQLKSEAESAKKERSIISEETAVIKADIQRIETETDLADEQLQLALQDLKAVKSSEATALENLKSVIEKTVRNRASASRPSPTITISKFEYEYLRGHAGGAQEIADKKVAAARAWVEALKASEREIQMKSELLRRESREMRVEVVQQNEKKIDEGDGFENWRLKTEPEKTNMENALTSKAVSRSVKKTAPSRRGNGRRSTASPVGVGTPKSASFTVRRRKKVMPNLAKFFSGKSVEENV
ncbi:hypothetical protein ABFS82_08G069200 [Erythranthe guttata]|uniref:Protein PLASTID MOVEMENT IMPAIRED 2 n=1 Tax=Erythranthe guttata TaxID=4155 RepID=A0A022S067_ERYGU|nr:PREDICTED: protein PLASTID MOVEMENT IMPAIRED 2 [Erythranthe guttata]XP_012854581.1 PREDICTED: protein PLASTID MOVEMENT IMPAIRED 2 [Erythranthe guttata]EYU44610.1 hypothetical protein MIMGU_mgv1a003024mg [Erythranthe guttata]|eukprot:XP_012854572.1 PREDICTED: protein PLASTID MOVEMENT IMPAIRED 2 [Erythranthe guttata]